MKPDCQNHRNDSSKGFGSRPREVAGPVSQASARIRAVCSVVLRTCSSVAGIASLLGARLLETMWHLLLDFAPTAGIGPRQNMLQSPESPVLPEPTTACGLVQSEARQAFGAPQKTTKVSIVVFNGTACFSGCDISEIEVNPVAASDHKSEGSALVSRSRSMRPYHNRREPFRAMRASHRISGPHQARS